MKTRFDKGDRVRLIRLDGTLTDEIHVIHDRWGGNDSPRNASFMYAFHEHLTHTDLLKHADDTSPVVVPDGGDWYIARGNNMGWGRSGNIDTAIASMRKQGGKVTDYVVHRVSKWTGVDGMGNLTYPIGIEPVEVKRVESKKKQSA